MNEFTYKKFCNSYYIKCFIRCLKEHGVYDTKKLNNVLKNIFNDINDGEVSLPHVLASVYYDEYEDFDFEDFDWIKNIVTSIDEDEMKISSLESLSEQQKSRLEKFI